MFRRSMVVCSLVLSGFASQAHAGFADWTWYTPVAFALETATAPAGPSPASQRCVTYGYLQLFSGFSTEVWCDNGGGLMLMNSIPTVDDPSVAMDRAPSASFGFSPSFFAYSDPGAAQIWYGVAGQSPELAVDGQVAHSLSLAHFADGTPYIVYRGPGDHIYTATRKPTGEWGNVQLTNNTSGTARWSVDAVISGNTVHITYWDETYQAVRYARWEAGIWTFETAKNLASGTVTPNFVAPAVAADGLGGAYIAFNGRDGLLHYLRRTGPGAWSERTFTPPVPVSFDQDRGPVGFVVDPSRRAHFLYGTGNGQGVKSLRYVNTRIVGGWQDSVMVSEANSLEGFRGIDMVKAGDRPDPQLLATWSFDLVGILGVGCGNCQ